MQTTKFADLTLSRLMLGTVQFGLNYGIANKSGQASREQVREILACAYEGGVNCLDTAAAYGESEAVLGEVLADLNLAGKMIVVSKVAHLADDLSAAQAEKLVAESVTTSLRRLRLEQLPICLFHYQENICYLEALCKLKDKGLVRHIGVSLSGTAAQRGAQIVAGNDIEAVQMPLNVLDRRYLEAGVLDTTQNRNIAVLARSVFLQGLLLMPDEEVLPELSAVLPVLRDLRSLAAEAGIGMEELCTRYVLGLDGVTCALTGVDSSEQMRQNIALFQKGPLPADLQAKVKNAVPDLPEQILYPALWSKRMLTAQARR